MLFHIDRYPLIAECGRRARFLIGVFISARFHVPFLGRPMISVPLQVVRQIIIQPHPRKFGRCISVTAWLDIFWPI